jgi:hypothetical protein
MNPKFTINIYKGYFEVSLQGEITLLDYAQLMQKVGTAYPDLPKNLRVLGIDNGATFTFKSSDALLISEMREAIVNRFESVKHAYVVSDPKNTALAMLTSSAMTSSNYMVEIFETKTAAINWLRL